MSNLGMKQCPQCQQQQHAARRYCANMNCGYEWPKRKSPAKPSAALPDSEAPAFAAALTSDGGVMLIWPRDEETVSLTDDEADIVRRVLAASAMAKAEGA